MSGDIQGLSASFGSVAVIGAGVSGLTAAYRFKQQGVQVSLFDSQERPGGSIQSYSKDGFIWERAANTMMSNSPIVEELIKELDLQDKRIFPWQQKKRFIVRNGVPQQIPSSPAEFLTTKILSTKAKIRLLAEPFLWKGRAKGGEEMEESVQSFLERHIGSEPVEYLADPFCAGTAGSSPASLAVKYSFPQLWGLEERSGSLLVGAIVPAISKKDKKQANEKLPRGSYSFLGGMQTLPNRMAQRIGAPSLRMGTQVQELSCSQQGNPARNYWKLSVCRDGEGQQREERFDAVVLTAPLHSLSAMKFVKDSQPYIPRLPAVTYQPMSMLINAFRAEDVTKPLPGFGVLVPSVEQKKYGFQSLGTLFSSFMFPDRAPPGEVLFTTFVGGSRNRELALQPSKEIQSHVLKDLERLLGVQGPPVFTQHVCWKKGFPEYGKDYGKVLEAIEALERDLPGLYYAGNHRGGLAVGRAMASGHEVAAVVAQYLKDTGSRIFTMADWGARPPKVVS